MHRCLERIEIQERFHRRKMGIHILFLLSPRWMLLGMSLSRNSLIPTSTRSYCNSLVHTWILAPNCHSLCKWIIGMFLGSIRWSKRIDLQHSYPLTCILQSCCRNSSSRRNQLCKFNRQHLESCHLCMLLDRTFQWHRGKSKPRKCLKDIQF